MGLLNIYDGVPVPPEGSIEAMKSPEARKQFNKGGGGVLAFHTTPFSGVWAPPLSCYRQATLLAADLLVRSFPLARSQAEIGIPLQSFHLDAEQ